MPKVKHDLLKLNAIDGCFRQRIGKLKINLDFHAGLKELDRFANDLVQVRCLAAGDVFADQAPKSFDDFAGTFCFPRSILQHGGHAFRIIRLIFDGMNAVIGISDNRH